MSKMPWMIMLLLAGFAAPFTSSAKDVVGWVERVKVYPGGITIKTKIDTGAKTSSLNCECIASIKKDGGQEWVSFTVKDDAGAITRLEKPVLRVAKIKRHFGEQQQRFVIKLGICLGSVYREEEITLVDRSGFNYQLLIGRNFLKDDFLVDPHDTFVTRANCKDAPA